MRKFAQCGPANDNDEAAVIITKKIEPSSAEELLFTDRWDLGGGGSMIRKSLCQPDIGPLITS